MRFIKWLRGSLIGLTLLNGCDTHSPTGSMVHPQRLQKMTKGVNLSHWFAQNPNSTYSTSILENTYTATDFSLLKSLGFRHVRFPIDPLLFFSENNPNIVQPAFLPLLNRKLDQIENAGLATVLELHSSVAFRDKFIQNPALQAKFVQFWKAFASHLSARNPEMLFLEVMNEPGIVEVADWQKLQAQLLAAMREGAPEHTLIAVGHKWSGSRELVQLKPYTDLNVVYAFHFYQPLFFTHQGANWGDARWIDLRNLPYPSSPEWVAERLESIPLIARGTAISYGESEWNSAKIRNYLMPLFNWKHTHNVAVICGEFGVYRPFVLPEDRLNWLKDIRTLMETESIGWTMWDYSKGFGIATETGTTRTLDMQTVDALMQ